MYARARARERLQQLAVAAGICLPIPLLAATGLSLPLPASVERLAAALVPWAGATTFDSSLEAKDGKGGSIIDAPREREPARGDARRGAPGTRSTKPGARAGDPSRTLGRPVAGSPGVAQKPTPSTPHKAPADQTAPAEATPPGQQAEQPASPSVDAPSADTPQPATPPPPPAPPPPPPPVQPPAVLEPVLEPVRPIVDDVTKPVNDLPKPPAIPKGGLPGAGN